MWYSRSKIQLPEDFYAKIDCFDVLASTGSNLSEIDGVHIFRPLHHFLAEGPLTLSTPSYFGPFWLTGAYGSLHNFYIWRTINLKFGTDVQKVTLYNTTSSIILMVTTSSSICQNMIKILTNYKKMINHCLVWGHDCVLITENASNLSYHTSKIIMEHIYCVKVTSLVYLKVQMSQ